MKSIVKHGLKEAIYFISGLIYFAGTFSLWGVFLKGESLEKVSLKDIFYNYFIFITFIISLFVVPYYLAVVKKDKD